MLLAIDEHGAVDSAYMMMQVAPQHRPGADPVSEFALMPNRPCPISDAELLITKCMGSWALLARINVPLCVSTVVQHDHLHRLQF